MSPTILVVDDDPDIRRIAALSLERIGGFHVVLAEGGREALELARRTAPDLVLLDVSMPDLDGPETLRALRRLPGMGERPVMFFTATASEAEAARLRGLGASGVIAKPFDVAALPRLVRGIVDRPQTEIANSLAQARSAFAARLPGKAAEIEALVGRSDWAAARRAAHKLSGSAATYGFGDLGAEARALEDLLLAPGPASHASMSGRIAALVRCARAAAEERVETLAR